MVTKPFLIRCKKCRWAETSTGIAAELSHLVEKPNNCPTCGKPRVFRCPRCGNDAKMMRVARNAQ